MQLTPEQLALREQRRLDKLRQLEARSSSTPDNQHEKLIIPRPWISLEDGRRFNGNGLRVKILTFNLLAQSLVRRELFPTSQCLKANQREPMLHKEILSHQPDILCLQEVDRLEKLIPVLEKAQYSHCYGAGPGKKHGCLIAYKQTLFTKVSDHLVRYDQEEVRETEGERARTGRSFQTRNIGIMVALKSVGDDSRGVIVATTHLFWHPKYTYERTRQAGIFVREIVKYQSRMGIGHWPCVIAGDFNFTPSDPAYALIVGDPLLSEQVACIEASRVVHVSVDPTVSEANKLVSSDNDEEEGVDPDRVITNARMATEADGLLSVAELRSLFGNIQLKSVYDIGLRQSRKYTNNNSRTFGDRFSSLQGRRGTCEPEYTSYTHYWKTVLDYIFVLDVEGFNTQILGLLAPHLSENLEPGLPQQGVCGSDHISLAAELCWHSIISSQD